MHPVPKYRRREGGLNRTLPEALPGEWIESPGSISAREIPACED